MSPIDLLAGVCARFTMLLHDEPEKLEALLKMAIRRYQDRAGAVGYFTVSDDPDSQSMPPYFLQLVSVTDADGNYHEAEIRQGSLHILRPNSRSVPPYRVCYLIDLTAIPLYTGMLPRECIGLIEQYLYHLIELPNNDRIRVSNSAAGLPVDHLPAASEVQARLDALDEAMTEEGFQLPSVSFAGDASLGGVVPPVVISGLF